MPKIVIIADDLTGATDAAAACAEHGVETIVLLSKADDDLARENAGVVAIDANTRCLTAHRAAEVIAKLVQRFRDFGALTDQALLFKKVDSTLRGHVAEELAAALNARRDQASSGQKAVALFAPAFPAQGRTTVQGRQMLHGIPLEETALKQGQQAPRHSSIADILGEAGLLCGVVDITTVRSGPPSLEAAMTQVTNKADVVICDAITDEDLQSVAIASRVLRSQTVWAGSAGLARHMPSLARLTRRANSRDPVYEEGSWQGPTLFVVGSLAGASREQARVLATTDVVTLTIQLSALSNEQSSEWREHARIAAETLRCGKEVLLILDFPEQCTSEETSLVMRSLTRIVEPCADHAGALVVTGGETARAVLDAWRVSRLRLLGEVEPGLPYSITEGWTRNILVLTKAGGFGTRETFLHCREFLERVKRSRHTIAQQGTVVENQKS